MDFIIIGTIEQLKELMWHCGEIETANIWDLLKRNIITDQMVIKEYALSSILI